jgi:hypothetical protein
MTTAIEIPKYYVVTKTLPLADVPAVRDTLSITPIWCCFISDLQHAELARQLAEEVIATDSDENAQALAQSLDECSIVLGDALYIDMIFPDGRKEALNG